MKSKTLLQWLLASLVVSGATELKLNSQETTPPPQRIPGRPALPQGGQGFFMAGLGPVGNILTDEQRASFRQAMEAQREKLRDVETKLRAARRQLLEAGLDGTFDEAAVRKQALAVASLEAEMAVIRAKAISQLQPPLSPEQIEKVKNGLATAPIRTGPRADELRPPNAGRRRDLTSTNRDENDLPPKQ
jgi:Spy/CpxP family protein refolding chaperone